MKKWIIIIAISVLVLAISSLLIGNYLLEKDDPRFVAKLVETNPEKISVVMSENDNISFEFEAEKLMPLASVFKLIIAVELVNQYQDNSIDINEKIPVEEVEFYNFIKDANSTHETWKDEVVQDKEYVTIKEIAEGMITYSSNPNTDYLIQRLGLDKINHAANKLSDSHTNIYPIGASVLIPHYLTEVKGLDKGDIINTISRMDEAEYEELSVEINKLLMTNKYPDYKDFYPTAEEQKIWSENAPKSTAKEYLKLLNNLDTQFNEEKYNSLLLDILEINQNQVVYKGGKNGETISVVNRVFKEIDEDGEKDIVIFTRDLDDYEKVKVTNNIDEFVEMVLKGEYSIRYY